MYQHALDQLSEVPYFTLTAVKQLVGGQDAVMRLLLHRWWKAGKVIRLKQKIYMTQTFWLAHRNEPDFNELVSQVIQPLSYVSGEYVLQRYGVMTEGIMGITAITSKNTMKVNNSLGAFSFRHIKTELYSGWQERVLAGVPYFRATKSKALFDYLYFKPRLPQGIKGYSLIEALRLNLADWSREEIEEFESYINRANSPKMNWFNKNLQEAGWQL